MLRLLLQPPRSLWASTGHYPHLPSREPVQSATARVPWSRDNFPGRTHGAPQAHPVLRTPPSSRTEWARAPESAAPLTPSCLSEEQTPSGDLHTEAGPNPKLKPQSYANKEEKGKFLPAASGAADKISTINLMYLHLWNTWIDNESSQIEEVDFGSNDIYIFFPFSLFVCICMLLCVILSV